MNKLLNIFYNTIKIKGTNFSNLLNEFKSKNIKIKKITRNSPAEMTIKFRTKHSKKIIAILNQKCYTIIEQNDSNIIKNFSSLFKRTGILIGLLFVFVLNLAGQFFVWGIKLEGDETLKTNILSVLSENGITKGTPKQYASNSFVKKILYDNLENISLISVSTRGTFLVINYTTRTLDNSDQVITKNIIAKSDGVISSILATSGTTLVKPNEYVKKGQVLIAGYEEKDGQTIECDAKGQVFAYVWKSSTLKYPIKTIEWIRTGNFVENYKVIYKNNVLCESKNPVDFKKFEEESKTSYLSNTAIPITICYTKSYELESVEITNDFESNKQKLFAQAKLLTWEQISGDENILEEKTETNFVSNIYFITHYIKIKEKIS